ncbi:hypothetical protein [Amycolatopsis sp. NPDC051372]|uniref:hypothetical protein n=1 Tax=Amycolatopsis sp. NPDC051372 TaxID=3155669 RepID=UPI00341D6EB7
MSTGAHFGGPPPATPAASTSGANFLDTLAEGATDPAAAKQINAGAQQFMDLAKSGGFAINEAGLKKYLNVCDTFLQGYDEIRFQMEGLATRASMGSSDYAQKVAAFNVKVAVEDKQSLIPNLELLRKGIEQVKQALQIARNNYNETENAHVDALNRFRSADS